VGGTLVRVLLVEDNAADAELTRDMLALARAPRYELAHARLLAEALTLLAAERFDVVLADLGLPDARGLKGVRALRAAAPETAIVVLSGVGSESVAVEALATGAQDYLVKGRADEDTLRRSIRFAIARHEADVAQRRLAVIVESSDDAILTTDRDARITSWNRGAERLFGHTAAQAVGLSAAMLLPPERAGEQRAMLDRMLGGERIDNHVTTRLRRDGSPVDVSLSASAITDAGGTVVAISAIIRDITESTRAAALLHAAQERFRIAFEEAPIGIALMGTDRRFIRVNAAFTQITGYAAAALEGEPTSILVPPGDPESECEALRALLEGRTQRYSADRRIVHRAGHELWVALNVGCVRDDDGEPQHFLAQMQDITDRRLHEARLEHMADHDPLTGLLNRRAFERELRDHIARGERYGAGGAALMVDLDHFKYYNDALGHQAGDELITRVATALGSRLRKTDVLARLGGDEFAVILPSAGAAAARKVAAELLECVRGEGMLAPDGVRNPLTASIGVAFFDDEPGLRPDDVMVNADLAMYDAKEAGRDRASFYGATVHPQTRMRSRVTWAEGIRSALDDGRFVLLAQPIVDLRGERPRRYELLLRMRSRDGDLIPPAAFLKIAEHLDLVQEIDRWVVTQATRLLEAHPGVSLEVNLSGKSIGSPALLELVERLLRETEVEPARLTFEITETAAVANIARARAFSERLRRLGCRFALDDFGAGFGSFYYLKYLPFDFLKIDGEFVRNCATDATDRLLVTAVVDIARGLGKETIAEFVGDDAGVAALRELGVDWGQGFHLGAPAPLEEQLGRTPSRVR